MTEICSFDQCTGCMACMESCSHNAISCTEDALGFRRPRINTLLCIDCGLCKRTCPAIKEPRLYTPKETLAIAAREASTLETTSSGGLATLISSSFIENGGFVYGCDGTDIDNIKYICATTIHEANAFKGSKYVQANLSGVFSDIRTKLISGQKVLFIGISCQIAGLLNYLHKEYKNLYTIDIICHGAASQRMVSMNAEYYKSRYSISSLLNVKFREKIKSINTHTSIRYGFYFQDTNGKQYSFPTTKDPFTLCYGKNLLFRNSCYSCQYAKPERIGDLTIGDFWGLGTDSSLTGENGVSLCIIHTEKGKDLLNSIKDTILVEPRSFAEAAKGNPQLITPTIPHPQLSIFRELLIRYGLKKASDRINRSILRQERLRAILQKLHLLEFIKNLKNSCHI